MKLPIYVISLAHAQDRRADITCRLTAAGVDYEITEAVDGAELNLDGYQDRLIQDLHLQSKGRELSRGEIGVFLSHYNLWKKMVTEQIPFALILEDDTTWDDDFFSVAKAAVASPYYWNIVHLATRKPRRINEMVEPIGKRKLVRYAHAHCNADAYLIDLDGAKKMQELCWYIRCPIDVQWRLCWHLNVYFYHMHPAPARQCGVSDIGERPPKNKQRRRKEMGRVHYFLRDMKMRFARMRWRWAHPKRNRK